MTILRLRAYMKLIQFDRCLAKGDFAALYEKVRSYPLGVRRATPTDVTQRICLAVDIACIWYWKQVFCLQRSAATACLLKRYGIPAQLVIGTQQFPFRAHAWVEVDGHVVNDHPYTPEIYTILDRC